MSESGKDPHFTQKIVLILFASSFLLSGICISLGLVAKYVLFSEGSQVRSQVRYVCPSSTEDIKLPQKQRNTKNQIVVISLEETDGKENEAYCSEVSKELSTSFTKILYKPKHKAKLLKHGALSGFGDASAQRRLIKGAKVDGRSSLQFTENITNALKEHERNMTVQPSAVTIVHSGFYHVYSRILFKKCSQSQNQEFFHRVVRHRPGDNVSKTLLIANCPLMLHCEYNTSYISGSFQFQTNDSLHVEVSHLNLFQVGDKTNNFFGVWMLHSLEHD